MKKHLTTLAAAMLLMSCGGNGSSSEAEASSPKSLEIPNDINTPYSISDLPIDKTDVVAITLDNDGRAHISIFGDGEKAISTDELRRMVAIQALSRNDIEAEDITEEQLNNFVSLPDIGMTIEEWAANYNKPLDELKRINAKGINPLRQHGEYYSGVRRWLPVIQTVAHILKDDADHYSLKSKKPEPAPVLEPEPEEEIVSMEPEPEIEAEEVLETEFKFWNSNIKPQNKVIGLAGYDLLIISDEDNAYENVENLLSDLRLWDLKFVTSQRSIATDGWWQNGKRNVRYSSFEGIGDFWDRIDYESVSVYYYDIVYPQHKITVIVDNVRDAQGNLLMDESTGRHKLTSWVITPGNDISQVVEADFSENDSNAHPTGLRRILHYRNEEVIDRVNQYKEEWRNNRISENEYWDRLKALKHEYEENDGIPHVVLKFAPGATYEAFIAAMDEMYINDILYWRIERLTPEETQYIKAHTAR